MEFTEAHRKFAALMGLPDDPEALRFAARLSRMNTAGVEHLDVAKQVLWLALDRALPLLMTQRKAA